MKATTVHLPPHLRWKLARAAAARKITLGEALAEAIELWLQANATSE
jgi:hypothetical protein